MDDTGSAPRRSLDGISVERLTVQTEYKLRCLAMPGNIFPGLSAGFAIRLASRAAFYSVWLSLGREWYGWGVSNLRPQEPQSCALTN
jgi:hypothetical protein